MWLEVTHNRIYTVHAERNKTKFSAFCLSFRGHHVKYGMEWNGIVEWNCGMEWNGFLEWNME